MQNIYLKRKERLDSVRVAETGSNLHRKLFCVLGCMTVTFLIFNSTHQELQLTIVQKEIFLHSKHKLNSWTFTNLTTCLSKPTVFHIDVKKKHFSVLFVNFSVYIRFFQWTSGWCFQTPTVTTSSVLKNVTPPPVSFAPMRGSGQKLWSFFYSSLHMSSFVLVVGPIVRK